MFTGLGCDIQHAIDLLQDDQLVGLPTETVYGLAGSALKNKTIAKIFKVKNRPYFDPLIMHTDSLHKIEHLVKEIPEPLQKLIDEFSPGPLTIVLEKTNKIPDMLTSGLTTVAVRIPNHEMTRTILQNLDFPLAAPSANPFGYISPTNALHVKDQLDQLIPYILDGGPCKIGIESTIVAQNPISGKIRILRKGGIIKEEIEKIVGNVECSTGSTSEPSAPGMLKSHYAPRSKLCIFDAADIPKIRGQIQNNKKSGALVFTNYLDSIPMPKQRRLSATADLTEAAQNLFAYLRDLDQLELDVIWAELVPDRGLGRAINDKLRRGAVPN